MAITSYPFESLNTGTAEEPVYDRAITAEDERLFNKLRYTNGVFASVGDALKVTANNNMTVTVGIGGGHIEGALFYNTAPITLNIDAASATLNRIDRVVAQFNTSVSVRAVSIVVRAGVAATNPVAPELRRESNFYEVALADISVKKGVASISTSAIKDQRLNSALCGEVIAAIPTPVDTTDLWNQYEASLNEWLDTVAAALDETLAGNLQNQITAIKNNTVVDSKNNVTSIPVVATKYFGASSQTGKLIVKLPQGFVGTMVKFTIEILEKYGKSLAEYSVLGQIFSGGSWATISTATCNGVGGITELPVSFGKEGDKAAITIGNNDTVWDTYSAIKIKDVTTYFTHFSLEEWASDWDISVGIPTGTYTVTVETGPNFFELNPVRMIQSGDDLNDYTDFGNFLSPSIAVSKSLKNCPLDNQGFSLRVMRGTSGAYRVQEIIAGLGDRLYRHYTGTTWSEWKTNTSIRLVWKNASPTSGFAAQKLTLSLTENSTIEVIFKKYQSTAEYSVGIFNVDGTKQQHSTYYAQSGAGFSQTVLRTLTPSTTGINFSNGTLVNTNIITPEYGTGYFIPIKIFEIKG